MASRLALTDADLSRLAAFLSEVRREWKKIATPANRAALEQRVRNAITENASALIRRAGDRCETCGSPDKDKRIALLERETETQDRIIRRVQGLITRRKTVRTDDLRAALDWEAARG